MDNAAEAGKKFRILSIDGGGVRGILPAAYLAELESRLANGRKLHDFFDIIAGTSTGGIIAAALAAGISAKDICNFYLTKSKVIFTPRSSSANICARLGKQIFGFIAKYVGKQDLNTDQLFYAKYHNDQLREKLIEVLSDKTFKETKTLLLMTTIDLKSGEAVVFKSPHPGNSGRFKHLSLVDAVLATTAAPTYFPAYKAKNGETYVDGGLWANNPSLAAYVEALDIHQHEIDQNRPSFNLEDIWILSISTGSVKRLNYAPPVLGLGYGLIWWLPKLPALVFHVQAAGTETLINRVLGSRVHRVGFSLTDDMRSLDGTDNLDVMENIGRAVAEADIHNVKRYFT